jgi:hypothetical protein
MTITLRAPLNDFAMKTTLFYYNTHCPPNTELKIMDNNKGFILEINNGETKKHIRKQGNMLTNCFNYKGFSEDEEILLYKSLCCTLGYHNVHYYTALSVALENSPSVLYSLTRVID